jgi:hypothetical protein
MHTNPTQWHQCTAHKRRDCFSTDHRLWHSTYSKENKPSMLPLYFQRTGKTKPSASPLTSNAEEPGQVQLISSPGMPQCHVACAARAMQDIVCCTEGPPECC